MTVFGFLWIFIVLWCYLKSDIKYMFFITLLFMTFQCTNVVVINGVGIGPQTLTSIIFAIKALGRYKGKIVYKRNYRKEIVLVFLLFVVVVSSCIYNNIFVEKLLYVLQLFSYILCFICIVLCKQTILETDLYKILRIVTIFHLVMGAIQLLVTSEILPIRFVLNVLFYNDPNSTIQFHFRNYRRIMSTFMEPSYLAGLLVGMFYFYLSMTNKWKDNFIIMFAIVIEILLTRSSTAYGAFFVVGLIFIALNKRINFKIKILVLIMAVVAFVMVYLTAYDLLDSVVFSKSESGSYFARTNMNNSAIQMFMDSPVLGKGYKNIRGSSIIYSLLGQLGMCGLLIYILLNLTIFLPILSTRRNIYKFSELNIGLRFSVMGAFFCQIIACPDLDLCTYWLWLYCIGGILNACVKLPQTYKI